MPVISLLKTLGVPWEQARGNLQKDMEHIQAVLNQYFGTQQPRIYANLPMSPNEGMLVPVTDSTTAVWGATISGGGTNHVLAYFDSLHWTVAAK